MTETTSIAVGDKLFLATRGRTLCFVAQKISHLCVTHLAVGWWATIPPTFCAVIAVIVRARKNIFAPVALNHVFPFVHNYSIFVKTIIRKSLL